MKPNVVVASRNRPSRILVALAAAWMILSLAVGGAVTAESRASAPSPITQAAAQR